MTTNKTIEMREQYSAPSCKAFETRLRNAILTTSTDSVYNPDFIEYTDNNGTWE